ncbi:MAG: biotin/lipoyl-binding protein [Suilimivivens sp.]
MNENTSKRREWVKNAAIIFLAVMLILTFFSNTIMNYSLPEVATQYVQRGTITAKVRGTGNVEATDPYNVMVKESRVIASVAVKQGDVVEKGQVLYYLEDAESEELKKAEAELEDLELAYMKGLFGGTVSPEVIDKVASGNTDSFASYQAKVTDMQNRLQAAENRVAECQKIVDDITLQSTINTNNAGISTLNDEVAKANAATDIDNATKAFNSEKEIKVAELSNEISEIKNQIVDLTLLVDSAETIAESVDVAGGGVDNYIEQRNAAAAVVQNKLEAIYGAAKGDTGNPYTGEKNIDQIRVWIDQNDKYADYQTLLAEYDAAASQYKITVESFNDASTQLSDYEQNRAKLAEAEKKLESLEKSLTEVNAISVESSGSVQEASKRLQEAEQNITNITNANKQSSVAYQNKLADAQAALKNAQAVYDLVKKEQTELAANINAELDLSKTSNDIAKKKEEIAKLKENSIGAEIEAPVAGTVTSLAYVAGETTKPEQAAAVIQAEGKGFTLSFSVTNEQAKKVQVGDEAELQNAWYYDDARAILSAIKPDPESAGQKKLLVFDISGSSIQAGQALNLSVGQRSTEYELVVPNSAVREDSNGKFILIVESKSGPISNRYIATRVDVEVLASDDNNTAISAGLYGYEYVITTSTKPVEAGKQVRLSEG